MRLVLPDCRSANDLDNPKRSIFLVLQIAVPLAVFFTYLAETLDNEVVGWITRDPNGVSGQPFYVGAISTLGVSVWLAATQMMLFGVALAARSSPHRRFLTGFGLLTGLLALDDMLQLHELVFPVHMGIPEIAVYLFYAASGLFLLFRHLRILLRNEPLIFFSAAGCLALSIFVDLIPSHTPMLWRIANYAWEDGSKFIGICLWATYFGRYVYRLARGEAR